MLLRQGADIDLILRLLAGELRIKGDKQDSVCDNTPKDRQAYRCFRQFVTHLSSIQDRRLLFVEPLMFDRSWQVAADSLIAEQRANLQKEFKVNPDITGKVLTITQRVTGRVILSNYDPQRLSNEERIELNDDADAGAMNDVMVDIRPDYPGGELPLLGVVRLRGF